jgi:DNA replication protein DnaC
VTPTDIPIETLCKRLHLANAPRIVRALAEQAEKEQWSYEGFVRVLLAEEVAHRQQTRLVRLSHKAQFPFLKTIDDFDFTFQSTLRLSMLGSYLSPDFVTDGRTLILSGKPSRGKTHLAIAIAYRAIQNGFDALFTTAAAMIEDLSRASAEHRLRDALATYTHPHVLVVDEVGYLSYGPDAANVLFHVVNDRHLRRRAMVFTTNKSLRAWGKVLHDQDLADAIVERILERGRLVRLDGPSMRTRHLTPDDLDADGQEPAIISGIDRPEFPERTIVSQTECSRPSSYCSNACPVLNGGSM